MRALRVEGPAGHDHAPELFGGVVALPERDVDVVAEGDEDPVRLPEAGHPQDVAPDLDAPLPALEALRHVDRRPRGPGCLAESGDFLGRDPQHLAEEKRLLAVLRRAQILLVDQGQGTDVIEGPNPLRIDVPIQSAVEWGVVLGVGQDAAEVSELDPLQAFAGQGLDPRVPVGPSGLGHGAPEKIVLCVMF